MQFPRSLTLSIPATLEEQSSYVLVADNKLITASINRKTRRHSSIKTVATTKDIDFFCHHDVHLIVDPRLSKSTWQESSAKDKNVFKKRYQGKRAMYIAEVHNDNGNGIVSQCDRASMEALLATRELLYSEITSCMDGCIGYSVLPDYFNTDMQTQVYAFVSQNHMFICAYHDHSLDYFSHITLDQDVADLRAIVLHDMIPVLREYKVLDHAERLCIVSFGKEEDKELINIINEDLNIVDNRIETVKSFEQFIVATSLYAVYHAQTKYTEYFNQVVLPIMPWGYTQITAIVVILIYFFSISYNVYNLNALHKEWQLKEQIYNESAELAPIEFVAVRSRSTELLKPNLEKIFSVILHDVPENIWLQSMLVQFNSGKFILQGWIRQLDINSKETMNIFDFMQIFAESVNLSSENIRIDNTDGRMLQDLMERKVSVTNRSINIIPTSRINLMQAQEVNAILATGFQATNLKVGEGLTLIPVNIGTGL